MRFLVDQDVYAVTVDLLRSNGHDVITASELGMSRTSDQTLLSVAQSDSRILLMRDRDYGAMAHLQMARGGVVYLRMLPSNTQAVHDELLRVLENRSDELQFRAFVVVEPARHRLRAKPK